MNTAQEVVHAHITLYVPKIFKACKTARTQLTKPKQLPEAEELFSAQTTSTRSCFAAQHRYFAPQARKSCWRVCQYSDDDLFVCCQHAVQASCRQTRKSVWAVQDYSMCFLAVLHPQFSQYGVVAATSRTIVGYSCSCLQTDKANLAHSCGLLMQPFANRQGKFVWLWSTASASWQHTAVQLLTLVGLVSQLTGVYRSSLLGVHFTVLHHFYMGSPACKHPHLLLRVGLGNHPGPCRPGFIICVKIA